ncbi:MAG: hypothetical protein OXI90_15440 [Gammaproteobacteria bacterium]|nr:hypothetical protein [Gammaproteobacteria bacterium]
MTVCVAVQVRDCIVFAVDSAVTVTYGNGTVANVWEHGVKLFRLHDDLPIMAMFTGMGSFGPATVSSVARYFNKEISRDPSEGGTDPSKYTMKEITERARDFFKDGYEHLVSPSSPTHQFELWLGGYSANSAIGEVWRTRMTNGKWLKTVEKLSMDQNVGSLNWGGIVEPISRLVLGIDPNARRFLQQKKVPSTTIQELEESCEIKLVDSAMPTQDAINFAEFLVDVTKGFSTFLPGATSVGGATDVATVARHDGFKWIKRKLYYPDHLNPENGQ